jgi:hypothetical protein
LCLSFGLERSFKFNPWEAVVNFDPCWIHLGSHSVLVANIPQLAKLKRLWSCSIDSKSFSETSLSNARLRSKSSKSSLLPHMDAKLNSLDIYFEFINTINM